MAAKQTSTFKVNQLAKDLGVKAKDLCGELGKLGITEKSNSASLLNTAVRDLLRLSGQ